ncbi:hypothetical protein IPC228_23405 [Pseudomonas aeruginosa]|nr:hypothetical protein IPC228_23405 [Pseudomonas aeruginosa]
MGTTDLNGGALFNAEFGIRHRGSTVPERSGVALSFCRRPLRMGSKFWSCLCSLCEAIIVHPPFISAGNAVKTRTSSNR